jgi:hypothetical protein
MHSLIATAFVAGLVLLPGLAAARQMPATKTFTLSAEVSRGFKEVQEVLAATAEKMPEADYAFRPTPEVRPFGQLIAHVALSQFEMCARWRGEPNPQKDAKEADVRSRAATIALLKGSGEYCQPLVAALTDATALELARVGDVEAARGLMPMGLVAHGMQMYGAMAVYLRLKGIVPPTTERQQKMKKSD